MPDLLEQARGPVHPGQLLIDRFSGLLFQYFADDFFSSVPIGESVHQLTWQKSEVAGQLQPLVVGALELEGVLCRGYLIVNGDFSLLIYLDDRSLIGSLPVFVDNLQLQAADQPGD